MLRHAQAGETCPTCLLPISRGALTLPHLEAGCGMLVACEALGVHCVVAGLPTIPVLHCSIDAAEIGDVGAELLLDTIRPNMPQVNLFAGVETRADDPVFELCLDALAAGPHRKFCSTLATFLEEEIDPAFSIPRNGDCLALGLVPPLRCLDGALPAGDPGDPIVSLGVGSGTAVRPHNPHLGPLDRLPGLGILNVALDGAIASRVLFQEPTLVAPVLIVAYQAW